MASWTGQRSSRLSDSGCRRTRVASVRSSDRSLQTDPSQKRTAILGVSQPRNSSSKKPMADRMENESLISTAVSSSGSGLMCENMVNSRAECLSCPPQLGLDLHLQVTGHLSNLRLERTISLSLKA